MLRNHRGQTRDSARRRVLCTIICLLAASAFFAITAQAETASESQMGQVAANWLRALVHEQGQWAGSTSPHIKEAQTLFAADTAVGLLYSIDPSGFILVPFLKALPPITAYSEESNLDVRDSVGLIQLFRDMLRVRFRTYVAQFGSLAAALPKTARAGEQSMWESYLLDDGTFAARLSAIQPMTQGDILLGANAWDQIYPWNNNCPADAGCEHSLVGCGATSTSQIMRYWQWPSHGQGSHCYFWQGAQNSGVLCANFDDPYDWANMPFRGQGQWTPEEVNALAELCYEVGVAYEMGYGCDASWTFMGANVWTDHFMYDPSTHLEYRNNYNAQGWFDLVVSECDAGRPMQFGIWPLAHFLVCDGWRIFSGNQIHMNYGWGGSTTAWYFVDNIYGSDPANECMMAGIRPLADSFYVNLSVQSTNPESGAHITVSPTDTNGLGDGWTPFVRKYSPGRQVSLTAAAISGGNSFVKWQREGLDYPGGMTVSAHMDKSITMTAVYLSCTEAVDKPHIAPSGPVCVNDQYCVTWNRLQGASSYEIQENGSSWVGTGTDTVRWFSRPVAGTSSYLVRAVSACGSGASSVAASIKVDNVAPSEPAQPWTDRPGPLCVNSPYSVLWDTAARASTYEVRENGGAWSNVGAVTVVFCMKSAAGVYAYEVRGVNGCGVSGASLPVLMTVTASSGEPASPAQPSILPPSPVCQGTPFAVRWDPVPQADSYEIRENGGEWRGCGGSTIWGVTPPGSGTYSYEVRALNGCGPSNPSELVTAVVGPCYDIIIFSLHPDAGVAISVSPPDQSGQGSSFTPFACVYGGGAVVTLEASNTVNGWSFLKWQRDGVDYSASRAMTFTVDASHTLTAVYQSPVLSVGSVNPSAGVPVTVVPADVNELSDGSTPFAREYEVGAGVTLQAPAKANGNPFAKWQRDGADYSANQTASLTMDTNYAMTAMYRSIASVVIESKTVPAGSVSIHLRLSNDVPIRKIVLPLEIREVTPGASITKLRLSYAERLTTYLTGISSALQLANPDGTCKNGQSGGYRTVTAVMLPDVDVNVVALPEGVSIVRSRVTDPALPAGGDALGSIILSVLVTGVHGSFEIDTTCTNPANHLLFTQEDPPAYTSIVPAFSKGMITIGVSGCVCPDQGDINDDTMIDVFDVIGVIGIAFSGELDPRYPGCVTTCGDVNSDGVTDVFDAIYLIATAFSGGPNPVDPCAP